MPKIITTILAVLIFVASADISAEVKNTRTVTAAKKAYKKTVRRIKKTAVVRTAQIATATETLLYDITNHRVIDGRMYTEPVSIASISKLMTVYTVVRDRQRADEILEVPRISLNHTHLRGGMRVTRADLIQLALVSSDNLAAHTLALNGRGGYDEFISRMNSNAIQLNMYNTVFVEPTGLSAQNRSTIQDLIALTQSVQHIPEFRQAAASDSVRVQTNWRNKTVKVLGRPTNKMFGQDGVQVIKTGFTNAAGFCIAMIVEKNNTLYNIVILGSKSKYERERIINQYLARII